MQRQSGFGRAVAAVLMTIAISAPVVRAEGETPIPYESPGARLGWPPGITAPPEIQRRTNTSPDIVAAENESATTRPEVRPGRSSGSNDDSPLSFWGTFMTWLREQALHAAGH
jgi:hypothetical protein